MKKSKKEKKSFDKTTSSLTNLVKKIFKTLYLFLIFVIKELLNIFKYFSIGIFKSLDFILTNLFTLFSYIFYGLMIVFKYIGIFSYKLGYFVFYILFKPIVTELYILVKNSTIGLYKTFLFIFYYTPKFLVNSLATFVEYLGRKFNNTINAIKTFIKETPKRIKKYFINKWNNLSIVKYYRNKKERELEILFIDKFGKDAERSEEKRVFQYLAKNQDGKIIKGYFSALSKLDTHSYLLDEGYEVYDIKTNNWINFVHGENKLLRRTMSNKDLIFWLTQLSTYVKSGIPLTESVKILAQQNRNRRFKKVYDSVIYELTMGESFSSALNKQGQVFPGLLVNMIKAAELIGNLEQTLDEMADYYTQREDTRKSMISAMTYPSIIFVFSVIVVSFILIYIIPKFEDVYISSGQEINSFTKFILDASDWLGANYLFLLLGIIGVLILYRVLFKEVKAFRTTMQYLSMHLPVIGKIIIYNEMTLFAKTFAALNKNNVLLTDSIDILSKITTNEIYKMIMYDTISNLLRGDKMSLSFKDNWAIPDLAYYMITTGESTGEISAMLEKISEFFAGQQKNMANTLKVFIEPIMIIVLATIVGGIIIAVLIPMFGIMQGVM